MSDASSPDAPVGYEVTDAAREAIARHRERVADRYLITNGDGWTELWCRDHCAGSEDYLGSWQGSPQQHARAILRARTWHERSHH